MDCPLRVIELVSLRKLCTVVYWIIRSHRELVSSPHHGLIGPITNEMAPAGVNWLAVEFNWMRYKPQQCSGGRKMLSLGRIRTSPAATLRKLYIHSVKACGRQLRPIVLLLLLLCGLRCLGVSFVSSEFVMTEKGLWVSHNFAQGQPIRSAQLESRDYSAKEA